jgi:SRSO17 transposase
VQALLWQIQRRDWEDELGRWLEPFLERLGHRSRQRMCPLYVAGLIGPGDRKSVQPMAERLAPGDYDQLHRAKTATLVGIIKQNIESRD